MNPKRRDYGVLPRFLKEHGAQVVIAGGIGAGAVSLLQREGIDLVTGAPSDTPANLVKAYLAGILVTGEATCGCHGQEH